MPDKITVSPIKSQGKKTKMVSWIKDAASEFDYDTYIEPFMGTGVVAFNMKPKKAILCDTNPHIIDFYNAIKDGIVNSNKARSHMEEEGNILKKTNGDHYYDIRKRFNDSHNPLDFLFLSRSCFNGLMRFNKSGGFNVPFCRKPERFSKALITKISNQIESVSGIIAKSDYTFICQDFRKTLNEAPENSLIYCDPPYLGRNVDYFDSWNEDDEADLSKLLRDSNAHWIVSSWKENSYRKNENLDKYWSDAKVLTREHFYHIGAKETNRNAITEALLMR